MSLTVAVTGGSSGIGLAIARHFAGKGHTVYSLSRRPSMDGVRHIPCDVTDEASVNAAFAALEQAEGSLDILINNAGFGISGAAEFTDLQKAKNLFDVGYFGLLACVKHALPLLRKSDAPLILNVGSLAAALPVPFQSVYSSAKAAVSALTLCLVNELRPFGIRVCAVLPGDVRTASPPHETSRPTGRSCTATARARRRADGGRREERYAARADRRRRLPRGDEAPSQAAVHRRRRVQAAVRPLRAAAVRFVNWIEGKLYG